MDLSGWEKIITNIAQDLHDGKIKPTDLNKDYILKTGGELNKAIDKGFGTSYKDEKDIEAAMSLKRNAWLFSSAKNIAMQYEMAEKMKDEKGNTRTFQQFKQEALKLNKSYNQNYLQAEYQTVLASSQAAKKWQDIQRRKERYPNLEYRTVGDSRVRDQHAALDKTIRPIEHAFWSTYYPPNGWRCRCYVTQTDRPANGDDTPTVDDKTVPPMFRENLAITNPKVLSSKHPYFQTMRKNIARIEKDEDDKAKKREQNGEKEQVRLKFLERTLPDDIVKSIPYEEVKSFKNGGKVSIHPFADFGKKNKHFFENYKGALYIADEFGYDVKIQYHLGKEGVRNPEYLINGKISDLKKPVNTPNKVIQKAIKQSCDSIVFNTENYSKSKIELINQIRGNFNNRIKNKEKIVIENIFIIDKGNIEEIPYKELMK